MQETWRLQFNNDAGAQPLDTIMEEIIRKNRKELGIFLSYYTRKEGAVAENVCLLGSVNFNEKLKGDFILSFTKEYFNACLNIHEKESSQMKIDFSIDLNKGQIDFIGPYLPERELDEL